MNWKRCSYLVIFVLSSHLAFGADFPRPSVEYFPRPSIAVETAEPDEIQLLAPLFSAQDQKGFESEFGNIIHDALHGRDADRQATVELLLRKSDLEQRQGMRRYMLLQAMDLAMQVQGTVLKQAVATKIIALPDIDCIALMKTKAETIAEMTKYATAGNTKFTPENAANAYFRLAELYDRADELDNAANSLVFGESWAKRNPDFASSIKPVVDKFKTHLHQNMEVVAALKKNSNDPVANYKMAMKLVRQSDGLSKAEPYFAKTKLPELQQVAEAVRSRESGLKGNLDIAAALINAMPRTQGNDDRMLFAFLANRQIQFVINSSAATESEKDRGKMLLLRVEGIVGKDQADTIANVAVKHQSLPASKFFGIETVGNRIVYIIDHSGSLLDNFDFLRVEVTHSVDNLTPQQQFAVVAFSEESSVLAPNANLQRATNPAKHDLAVRIKELKAMGENDDMLPPFQNAFETAFKLNPDTIYFLTDGKFDGGLFDVVKRLNSRHHAKINTMAFVTEDPKCAEQLQQLAKDNGGTYMFVSVRDLGK